jgi:hypothetical protein
MFRKLFVLPEFDYYAEMPDSKTMILDPRVELQLYEYLTAVASIYRKNPFHNFEHASHEQLRCQWQSYFLVLLRRHTWTSKTASLKTKPAQ